MPLDIYTSKTQPKVVCGVGESSRGYGATAVAVPSPAAPKPAVTSNQRTVGERLGDAARDAALFARDETVVVLDVTVTQAAASFTSGMAAAGSAFFNTLDQWVRVLEKPSWGIHRGGAFAALSRDLRATAAEYAEQGFKPQDGTIAALDHHMYAGAGQAAFNLPMMAAIKLPTFTAMTGGAQAAQAGENVAIGAAVGLAQGLVLHGILKATGFFPLPERIATNGLIFGGTSLYEELQKTAAERDYAKVVADSLIGAGLSGGSAKAKTRQQLLDDVKSAYGPKIIAAANELKAVAESPGFNANAASASPSTSSSVASAVSVAPPAAPRTPAALATPTASGSLSPSAHRRPVVSAHQHRGAGTQAKQPSCPPHKNPLRSTTSQSSGDPTWAAELLAGASGGESSQSTGSRRPGVWAAQDGSGSGPHNADGQAGSSTPSSTDRSSHKGDTTAIAAPSSPPAPAVPATGESGSPPLSTTPMGVGTTGSPPTAPQPILRLVPQRPKQNEISAPPPEWPGPLPGEEPLQLVSSRDRPAKKPPSFKSTSGRPRPSSARKPRGVASESESPSKTSETPLFRDNKRMMERGFEQAARPSLRDASGVGSGCCRVTIEIDNETGRFVHVGDVPTDGIGRWVQHGRNQRHFGTIGILEDRSKEAPYSLDQTTLSGVSPEARRELDSIIDWKNKTATRAKVGVAQASSHSSPSISSYPDSEVVSDRSSRSARRGSKAPVSSDIDTHNFDIVSKAFERPGRRIVEVVISREGEILGVEGQMEEEEFYALLGTSDNREAAIEFDPERNGYVFDPDGLTSATKGRLRTLVHVLADRFGSEHENVTAAPASPERPEISPSTTVASRKATPTKAERMLAIKAAARDLVRQANERMFKSKLLQLRMIRNSARVTKGTLVVRILCNVKNGEARWIGSEPMPLDAELPPSPGPDEKFVTFSLQRLGEDKPGPAIWLRIGEPNEDPAELGTQIANWCKWLNKELPNYE